MKTNSNLTLRELKKFGINVGELYHFSFSGMAFITLMHTSTQCKISKPDYIE
jgi:hypothetical protein